MGGNSRFLRKEGSVSKMPLFPFKRAKLGQPSLSKPQQEAEESAARQSLDLHGERERLLKTAAVSGWKRVREDLRAPGAAVGGAPVLSREEEQVRLQAIRARLKILTGKGAAAKAGAIGAFERSEGAARIKAAVAVEQVRQLPLAISKRLKDYFVRKQFQAAYQKK